MTEIRSQRSAFASLAHTLNRIGVHYAKWASEAAAQGKAADYRRYRNEADRKFRDARWNLDAARRREARDRNQK